MAGLVFLPAFAALLVQGHPGAGFPALRGLTLAADSEVLANAIDGQPLELALRGSGMAVQPESAPALGGCATRIAVNAPVAADTWSRLLNWKDVAWTGALPDGRVMVAFYEQEGRLPGDRLAFSPADPAAFSAALARVNEACRLSAGQGERILSDDHPTSRSCYFARHPGLELVESVGAVSAPDPTRAIVTMLAKETPEAELRLLIEKSLDPTDDGWGRPDIAFTVAGLNRSKISTVRFEIDGKPVTAGHSIILYGDTRMRIRMNPFAEDGSTEPGFYQRLATANQVRMTLLDADGVIRAILNFDTGADLSAARRAFAEAAWSCTAAVPTPAPVTQWQVAP